MLVGGYLTKASDGEHKWVVWHYGVYSRPNIMGFVKTLEEANDLFNKKYFLGRYRDSH